VPPTLESRGCSLLELRCWSLTMTGLRLALRAWWCSAAAAAWINDAAISAEQRIVASVFRILISAMLAALFQAAFVFLRCSRPECRSRAFLTSRVRPGWGSFATKLGLPAQFSAIPPELGHCSTRSALHTKKKGRRRYHKRPKSREETPSEGSDSGMGLGVATA
jgi:hypothetical protein